MSIARFALDRLLSQVTHAAFPALAELEFNASLRAVDLLRATAVGAAARGGLSPPPPPLTAICVGSLCAVSALNIAAAFAEVAPACLTSLAVSVSEDGSDFYDSGCTGASAESAWSRLFAALGRCTGLQVLELSCLDRIPLEESGAFCDGLAAVLTQLRQLTHLGLQAAKEYFSAVVRPTGGVVWLDGRIVGRGVAALTALESLWIAHGDGTVEFDAGQQVLDACTGLRLLTRLGLCCHGLLLEQIRDAVPKLPALRHLMLPTAVFSGDSSSAACVSQFRNVEVDLVDPVPDRFQV